MERGPDEADDSMQERDVVVEDVGLERKVTIPHEANESFHGRDVDAEDVGLERDVDAPDEAGQSSQERGVVVPVVHCVEQKRLIEDSSTPSKAWK